VGFALRGSANSTGPTNAADAASTATTPPPTGAGAQGLTDASTPSHTASSIPAPNVTTPPPTAHAPIDLVGPTERYTAPGGLNVDGPAGWRLDRSAGIANIRDYVDPSSPERLSGGYFRIGIGNPTPRGSFTDEVDQAANFLRTTYTADIRHVSYTTFLGATAADIEYSYVPDGHATARHGIERLSRRDGHTLILQVSDLDTRWARTQAIFMRLTATATVD
jgi:hypothetical protein